MRSDTGDVCVHEFMQDNMLDCHQAVEVCSLFDRLPCLLGEESSTPEVWTRGHECAGLHDKRLCLLALNLVSPITNSIIL